MAQNKIEQFYKSFQKSLIEQLQSNDFYDFFLNAIGSGKNEIMAYEKMVDRHIDLTWVEAIEKSIIPLDNIIRNPGRYIKNEEEIVPIELVRRVSPESIRHLAQHTSMISSVKGDEVMPNKLLNVIKEESYDTYENRLIYTLLMQVEYFLDVRMRNLMQKTDVADELAYKLSGEAEAGSDKLKYAIEMEYTTPHVVADEKDLLLNADVAQMSKLQRVERIRKIFYAFRSSQFAKQMAGAAMVRPPLTFTNKLKKHPDYIAAVELWQFLNTYGDAGYNIELVERQFTPSEGLLRELYGVVAVQYAVLKCNTGRGADISDYAERKKVLTPNILKKQMDDIADTYDLSVEEVRKIFLEHVALEEKKEKVKLAKMRSIIARAMKAQRDEFKSSEKSAAPENTNRKKKA